MSRGLEPMRNRRRPLLIDLTFVVLAPALIGTAWGRSSDVFPEQPYAFGVMATVLIWVVALWFFIAGPGRRAPDE